jgi:anionic cell wall polymer biosynthesis LytR-Cps2A-Psr (LCP) family protein
VTKETLIALARYAYWYGEDTGDYGMHWVAREQFFIDALAELTASSTELTRLRAALEQIAATTGSDDPCRKFVDIARRALGDGV